jgi:hypothetical protein
MKMFCGNAARGAENVGVLSLVFRGDSLSRSVSSLGIDHDAHIAKAEFTASIQALLLQAGRANAQG